MDITNYKKWIELFTYIKSSNSVYLCLKNIICAIQNCAFCIYTNVRAKTCGAIARNRNNKN